MIAIQGKQAICISPANIFSPPSQRGSLACSFQRTDGQTLAGWLLTPIELLCRHLIQVIAAASKNRAQVLREVDLKCTKIGPKIVQECESASLHAKDVWHPWLLEAQRLTTGRRDSLHRNVISARERKRREKVFGLSNCVIPNYIVRRALLPTVYGSVPYGGGGGGGNRGR